MQYATSQTADVLLTSTQDHLSDAWCAWCIHRLLSPAGTFNWLHAVVSVCMQVFQLVQQQGGQLPNQDLAPLLHLYKARLAVACHNHKAAKKEVSCHCLVAAMM
jgi:hypothetical protein